MDDVIIHSNSWAQHMRHVGAVLKSLRQAGLTANPKKCAIGRMAPRPKAGGGGMWWWGCGFDIGCRREWTRGSREIVRVSENQVISGNSGSKMGNDRKIALITWAFVSQ